MIETQRLILRPWRAEDIQPYYEINQDSQVLEYLPGPLTLSQVEEFFSAQNQQNLRKQFMLWAVEHKESGNLLGFVGLNDVPFSAHFTPAVEIGWRLGSQYWGQGFASEGAKCALNHGFSQCRLEEIVAFTVPENHRSRRVMRRCGMYHQVAGNFCHPSLDKHHPLSEHVLYSINIEQWRDSIPR